MVEKDYQNQELVNYLLGSLSVAETERLDELSFTDDRFADALRVAENDLTDAYARGELRGETLKKFQSHYLASPARRQKVDFAEAFRLYTSGEKTGRTVNSTAAEETPEKTGDGFFSLTGLFKNRNPLLPFGFALAALILIAAIGFQLAGNHRNLQKNETIQANLVAPTSPEPPHQAGEKPSAAAALEEIAAENRKAEKTPPRERKTAPKSGEVQTAQTPEKAVTLPKSIVAAFVLSPAMRGGEQVKNLAVPKQATEIIMRLELEADDYPAYRIALTDESGSVNLWRSGRVTAKRRRANKSVNARFPAKLLKPQIQMLIVSGINSSGEEEIVGSYVFRSAL